MTTTPVLPVVGYIGPRGQMRQARWMEEDAPVCKVSDALAAIAAAQIAQPTDAELLADAERYQWLVENAVIDTEKFRHEGKDPSSGKHPLDCAIDAAIAASKGAA